MIMKSTPFLTLLYIYSCGPECKKSCGSRNFRTCCFNYLRKRSGPPSPNPPTKLKLELWFAKSQLEKLNKQNQLKRMREHHYREDAQDNQNEIFQHYYKPVKLFNSAELTETNGGPEIIVEDTSPVPALAEEAPRLEFIYDT